MSDLPAPTPPRRLTWLHLWLLGAVALPVLWLYVDPWAAQIQTWLQSLPGLRAVIDLVRPLGKFRGQAPALGVGYLLALLLARKVAHRWLLVTFIFLVAQGVVVNVVKVAVHRERPAYVSDHIQAEGWQNVTTGKKMSFPSGDTSSVFAIALAAYLFWPRVGAAAFVLATLIGLARVYYGRHYPADILGGILLGTGVPTLVLRKWKRLDPRHPRADKEAATETPSEPEAPQD